MGTFLTLGREAQKRGDEISLISLSLSFSRGGWKGTTTTNQLHPVLLLLLLLSSSSTSSPCFPLVSRTISMISARVEHQICHYAYVRSLHSYTREIYSYPIEKKKKKKEGRIARVFYRFREKRLYPQKYVRARMKTNENESRRNPKKDVYARARRQIYDDYYYVHD